MNRPRHQITNQSQQFPPRRPPIERRHLRELSRHKAPLFALPAQFQLDCKLRLLVHAARGAGDDDDAARGGGGRGGRGRGGRGGGGGFPAGARGGGGGGGVKVLGEARFSLRELLRTERRQVTMPLVAPSNTTSRYGDVGARTGEVTLRATPVDVTRGGVGKGQRPAAPPGQVRSIHWSPYDRVRVVNADP